MKISLNWLKKYIILEGISTDEIVNELTMSGLEVEDVIDQNKMYKDFIVGLVTDKKKHSNADKLSVCMVSDGKENFQVVCGAPNVEKGQKVVFAPVGTFIPAGNFEIRKTKIRGVESFGMICAEDELGISDDHTGIMVLDAKLKEGTSISDALGLNDVIFEIALTPNRQDALSHIGVARDLAAIFKRELNKPKIKLVESKTDINELASISIEDKVNCPRYSARVVTDVKIEESPDWLKRKITSIGLRPINNIVDITNMVLHECGQPLHAFDLDRLNGQKIVVKSTKTKGKFTTLDSKVRELDKDTLMICDAERNVAIAGVMGGENSEVYDDTKNVLIESAYFNPSSVRRTSKYLLLSTDASYRFERGTDPDNTIFAADRTAQLISEIAGGKIARGVIDVYPNKIKERVFSLRLERVSKLLGYSVKRDEIIRILTSLGFKVEEKTDDKFAVTVPNFRSDIEGEVDFIEEIARISGYNNVPTITRINIPLESKQDETSFTNELKEYANSLGLYEMINNPLQTESMAKLTGIPIQISNPLSKDMEFLRTSLLPGALSVIERNLKRGEKSLAVYEVGNVFKLKDKNTIIKSFDDYSEEEMMIIVITGDKIVREWFADSESYNFFDLKGIVDTFLDKIKLDNPLNDSYYANDNTIYDESFTKSANKDVIGFGGSVLRSVLKKFDIDQEVFCFELNLNKLKRLQKAHRKFTETLKYPKVIRDFAFIFDKKITYQEVKEFINVKSSGLLKEVNVFDIFESEELGNNKKSMAFQLTYFDENRTLEDVEVEKDFENLIKIITKKFDARLRG
ncbi:MAG: phenylalanine--tRNA ligase subunit beta [Ignavibacteria bacterium]